MPDDRDLIPYYRKLAAQGSSFFGLSILNHKDIIRELIVRTYSRTLLDYGCGRGDQYGEGFWVHRHWRLDVPTLYDPAFPEHDTLPTGTFHGVLCSDVMEHVPLAQVDDLVARLFGYAERFVWASICCRPAKKCFPDGRNMHVTLQPMDWWRAKFKQHAGGKLFELTETF